MAEAWRPLSASSLHHIPVGCVKYAVAITGAPEGSGRWSEALFGLTGLGQRESCSPGSLEQFFQALAESGETGEKAERREVICFERAAVKYVS